MTDTNAERHDNTTASEASDESLPLQSNDHRLEASRIIPATAEEIFAVLSDPQGHVAIDSSGMLQSADGDTVSQIGDTFVVHMDREALGDYDLGKYEVRVVITAFAPGTEIAWTIEGNIDPPIGHVYGYRLIPVEGAGRPDSASGTAEGAGAAGAAGDSGAATTVLSYYDWSNAHPDWRDSGVLPVLDAAALRATLGILERAVRRGYPRP